MSSDKLEGEKISTNETFAKTEDEEGRNEQNSEDKLEVEKAMEKVGVENNEKEGKK